MDHGSHLEGQATIWDLAPPLSAAALAAYDGMPPLPAQLLANRGIAPAEAPAFLAPRAAPLPQPLDIPGVIQGMALVRQAHRHHWPIAVYGDYDVDGLTAQAILLHAFDRWGIGPLFAYTPHRMLEGYGLHRHAVEALAAAGVKLLITVDCGTADHVAIARARALGVHVLVIDHHRLTGEDAPSADVIVNPNLRSGSHEAAVCCGAGLAALFVEAICRTWLPPEAIDRDHIMALAALGTVADVASLTGGNRAIVARGLAALRTSTHPGILALAKVSRFPLEKIESANIGFALGPRINAAGRMAKPEIARRLLNTTDRGDALLFARVLDGLNRGRQVVTAAWTQSAIETIDRAGALPPVIVAHSPDWSAGLVGLVAGNLAQRYHRPAIACAITGEMAQGSGRSIPGIDLLALLTRQEALLTRYGGHTAAAGLSLPTNALSAFAEALTTDARRTFPLGALVPHRAVDALLRPADCTYAFWQSIQALAPFGQGNPAPLFGIGGARPGAMRAIGAGGRHLSLEVTLPDQTRLRCIGFGMGDQEEKIRRKIRMTLYGQLVPDTYRGGEEMQFQLAGFR